MELSGANCVRNTISVPSVTEYADKVRKGGGSILNERMPIAGIGYWAVCMVTEGNTFWIMENDPPAKQYRRNDPSDPIILNGNSCIRVAGSAR